MRTLSIVITCAVAVHACSSDYPIWIPRDASADPMYRFVRNGKAGVIESSGQVVIEPSERASGNGGDEFHDGLLSIGFHGKYVDRAGRTVINRRFDSAWDFSDGLAAVKVDPENMWGFIDTKGEFAIPPNFPGHPKGYPSSFSEGLAAIETNGAVGYIDKTGTFVIPQQFLEGALFREGMARVVLDGPCFYFPDGPCGAVNQRIRPAAAKGKGALPACKFTFIDITGKPLAMRFDGAKHFAGGLAPAKRGDNWGYIDKTGRWVLEPRYAEAEPFSEGIARVGEYPTYGYINKQGAFIIAPQYASADDFHDGVAVVGDEDEGYFYIDSYGRRAIPNTFRYASSFFRGLAHVEFVPRNQAEFENGLRRFAYIDRSGKRVFEYVSTEGSK